MNRSNRRCRAYPIGCRSRYSGYKTHRCSNKQGRSPPRTRRTRAERTSAPRDPWSGRSPACARSTSRETNKDRQTAQEPRRLRQARKTPRRSARHTPKAKDSQPPRLSLIDAYETTRYRRLPHRRQEAGSPRRARARSARTSALKTKSETPSQRVWPRRAESPQRPKQARPWSKAARRAPCPSTQTASETPEKASAPAAIFLSSPSSVRVGSPAPLAREGSLLLPLKYAFCHYSTRAGPQSNTVRVFQNFSRIALFRRHSFFFRKAKSLSNKNVTGMPITAARI